MKTTFLRWGALAFLLSTLNPQLSTLFAQGSLTPPGAPAPTMKSLSQIEPRTPISSLPFTISSSGAYYLTQNLTTSSGTAITISSTGIDLDLSGFTISSTSATASGTGISINAGLHDITIHNGHIVGGVTYNGTSFTNGPGFANGISTPGSPTNVLVSGVTVSGCSQQGIVLGTGAAAAVEFCSVRTVGTNGIFVERVSNSSATQCGAAAITGNTVENCRGECVSSDFGINANATATNCWGTSSSGEGISATTAANCLGSTGSSSLPGIGAFTAAGCWGSSVGGSGLSVHSATGCYGQSGSGSGISTDLAENCSGSSSGASAAGLNVLRSALNCYGVASSSGNGISAGTAENCYGVSGSGNGVFCAGCAINCYGQTAGFNPRAGVFATTAQNCHGVGPATGAGALGVFANAVASNCFGQANQSVGSFAVFAQLAIGCYGAPQLNSAGDPEVNGSFLFFDGIKSYPFN